MSKKQAYLIFAIVLSLALLIPGISLPMMTVKADINQQGLIAQGKQLIQQQGLHPAISQMAIGLLDGIKYEGEINLIDKTRSILATSHDLWKQGYSLVAVLILIFSTLIPLLKILLMIVQLFMRSHCVLKFNSLLSKWSMADVFAIGMLIAFLTTRAAEKDSALITFHTQLHQGFYWFVAYCLFSAILGQWLLSKINEIDNEMA